MSRINFYTFLKIPNEKNQIDVKKMYKLAVSYKTGQGDFIQDFKTSFYYFKKLADMGFAPAINAIGWFHEAGVGGVKQDKKKAFKNYLEAGDKGCACGYFNCGLLYDKGEGVTRNPGKALEYYSKAKVLGCVEAAKKLME